MMVRSFCFIAVLVSSSFLFACSGSDNDGSSGGNTSGGTSGSSGKTGGSSGKTGGTGETGETGETGKTGETTPTEPKKKGYGSQCKESAECESDFCVFQSGSIGMCTKTCEDSIDCPGLGQKCVKVSDAPQKVCVPE